MSPSSPVVPSPLSCARALYKRVFRLSKNNMPIVDYILSLALASQFRFSTEATWGCVLGPPSSGKSEMVRPIGQSSMALCVDSMTENSLLSGWSSVHKNQSDPSLMPRLSSKVLVIEEFSTILAMDPRSRDTLLSQLRAAYKGTLSRAFGTGTRTATARFSIIACATPEIESFLLLSSGFGKRFLCIRMSVANHERLPLARHASRMARTQSKWRGELTDLVSTTLQQARDFMPSINPNSCAEGDDSTNKEMKAPPAGPMEDQFVTAMSFCACARTLPAIDPNGFISPPPLGYQEAESPARLSKQLTVLTWARCYLDSREIWNEEDMQFAFRIAWDSVPRSGQRILSVLHRAKGSPLSLNEIATRTHLVQSVTGVFLGQYIYTGLVEAIKIKAPGRETRTKWILSPPTYDSIRDGPGALP